MLDYKKAFRQRYGLKKITRASITKALELEGYRDLQLDGYAHNLEVGKWRKDENGRCYSTFEIIFSTTDQLIEWLMSEVYAKENN